ncbi:SulP family inorganic anion transporter [Paenactinomyces guangxiensis]|uniref:SulP family inorganic anion transporter n=1 Tax=Paenactinomyces guangxiensis TaxID=1490290 RepID=A0A7W1WPZ9_9BACL|nr:SulP family inorganic anion transporter [Paenactinomyces guangxiensis]MBA4493751.1 SulP family inorganic anion transporter [Paenactinomyces guangxiensis]MBH8591039.1 SulP family inorganic anion transporter [Paenactinomyces guangxiensis]
MISLAFDRKSVQKDILAGITAAVVALPLALGFGVASGLGAEAGLYGAIGLGLFAAIFGGTRSQISGPTGPMTVVSATVIASFTNNLALVVSVFLLAGLFQIAFGLLRIGQYVKYIPYPVISGFMSGIGMIIILLQLYPSMGIPTSSDALDVIMSLPQMLPKANLQAVILAGITIAIIYLFPKITKQIPSTLVALITGTLISILFDMKVPLIGEIPAGLPGLQIPSLSLDLLNVILIPALTLAALGSLDSLLTSVVADKLTREKHQSNRELIGQGIGNAVAALIGGIPGAGATMRTVVNIQAGGRSRLSGVTHALTLLVILLALGPYASRIPMPVLAGILITVGIGIIDYRGFKDLLHVPRSDLIVKLTVLALTVFIDLLQAVAMGMVLAALFFVKKMGDIITQYTRTNQFYIPWNKEGSILIKRLTGPFFFGFSNSFEEMVSEVSNKKEKKLHAIILDMSGVPYIDQSGFYTIEETMEKLNERKIPLLLVLPQGQAKELLRKTKLSNTPYIHFVNSFEESIDLLREQILAENPDFLSSALGNFEDRKIPDEYRTPLLKKVF